MIDNPIEAAAQRLRAGELVAFPTETVYGLGADATNPLAIAKIYALKGRPSTNPLIAHVCDTETAQRFSRDWPDAAERLAAAFWPGPLTLVLPKHPSIADNATAGLPTVGLRVPAHPVALALLRAFGGALAAPSANRSNHVSPTTAAHVRDEFGDACPEVLDGGPCRIGLESTVLSLASEHPTILRPGHVTAAQIEAVLGRPVRTLGETAAPSSAVPQTSPGQLPVHYAPRTPAFRFTADQRPTLDLTDAAIIELTLDPHTYARNLYARLRLLDQQQLRAIYIELPPAVSDWQAARDRVLRATKPYTALP
ncbi:MAG: L-threonylcarbamoyladenylate synthase [Tepidisphaeraceae bacterium]